MLEVVMTEYVSEYVCSNTNLVYAYSFNQFISGISSCRYFSFHSDTKNNRKVMFVRMTSNNAHTLNHSFCPVRASSGLNTIKHLYAKHVETHSRTLPNSIRQILLSARQRAIWILCKHECIPAPYM